MTTKVIKGSIVKVVDGYVIIKPDGDNSALEVGTQISLSIGDEVISITDESIDEVFSKMPGGVNGWLRYWGYQTFAKAILHEIGELSGGRIKHKSTSENS